MLPDTQQSIGLSTNSPEAEESKRSGFGVGEVKSHKRKEVESEDDVIMKRHRHEHFSDEAENAISRTSPVDAATLSSKLEMGNNAPAPSLRFSDISATPKRRSVVTDEANDSGWISAVPSDRKTHTHSFEAPRAAKREDVHLPQEPSLVVAETVERPLNVRIASSSAVETMKRSRGRSNFAKNYVRRSNDSLNICKQNMNVLLPKESEREVQVQFKLRIWNYASVS